MMKKTFLAGVMAAALSVVPSAVAAQKAFKNISLSDNGNGTYTNPVVRADFPDPDVVRVGDTYYMLSTTMHLFPGATVLKSNDLVNWEYCANPLERLSTDDKYSLIGGVDSYAQGMWAGAIGHHDGLFYILINGNDAGGWLLTAEDPEGEWRARKLDRSYYDPGLMFDNDRVYVVCGIGNISVCELDEDFNFVRSKTVITNRDGLEGSKLYHIGGYYYIYATYGGWPSGQAVFRATSVMGDYQEKMLVEKTIDGQVNTVHQGALIETPEGEWWTILQQDLGALGRFPTLHPVKWVGGWPVVGNNGRPVATHKKPQSAHPDGEDGERVDPLPTNDSFRNYRLGPQWQWNHNPVAGGWSLLERPGHLRLYTSCVTDDFMQARGSLTQRIFFYDNQSKPSRGTICLSTKNMKEGDMAGIAIQQDPWASVAVTVKNGMRRIVWSQGELRGSAAPATTMVNAATTDLVYLRAQFTRATSKAQFYYSLDNKNWKAIGTPTTQSFNLSVFVGSRFALFNYATQQTGGYVDIDWFTTEDEFEEADFYPEPFDGFPAEALAATELTATRPDIELMVGRRTPVGLVATYADGHTEDVSARAEYSWTDTENLSFAEGMVGAPVVGAHHVTASFTDMEGNTLTASFNVNATCLPFSREYISSFWGDNNKYDEDIRAFTTAPNGQMGWRIPSGALGGSYSYLVLTLDKPQTCGAKVFIFTEDNIWASHYEAAFQSGAKRLIIPLKRIYYAGTSKKINPADIVLITVWSEGGSPIDFEGAILTNNPMDSPTDIAAPEETPGGAWAPHPNGSCVIHSLAGQSRRTIEPGFNVVDGQVVWQR